MNNAGMIAPLVINKTPPKHRRMEKRTKKDRESAVFTATCNMSKPTCLT